ncbi:MAG: hypothetical protein KDC74_08235 [Flavobacteriaceae bacterium]|nr:hypothetical protein [Flavobacteriaceae bacterium]MCB0486367.1 hypothetical protein [Flavobacteriaceae bacterium]
MKFNNVQILRLKEIDQVKEQLTEFPEDDIKISSIGYTTKDDIQFLGYLAEINPDIEDYAISIYSENGQALIIYCDTVELELQGN